MDGGSGINILYTRTLEWLDIPMEALWPSNTKFRGIIPGRKEEPLGEIMMEVTFNEGANYRCELIIFEVVPFSGGYDAICGRSAFSQFMVVPHYTYMQLKMPGPRGTITIHRCPLQAIRAE
jgi:hypothetical protein